MVMTECKQTSLELELRPDYRAKIAKIVSGKHLSMGEFKKEVA